MCMTFGPARLARTRLYAGEARLGGKYVHVIAYQNHATTAGPNAMILPLPAAAPLTEQNVIDTRSFSGFLEDIHRANHFRSSSPYDAKSMSALSHVRVFAVGSYTVVLAARPAAIASALARVPERRRPEVNPAMLQSASHAQPRARRVADVEQAKQAHRPRCSSELPDRLLCLTGDPGTGSWAVKVRARRRHPQRASRGEEDAPDESAGGAL
jgi:hypothetical protein